MCFLWERGGGACGNSEGSGGSAHSAFRGNSREDKLKKIKSRKEEPASGNEVKKDPPAFTGKREGHNQPQKA